jgi:hypothetical protein
VGPNSLVYIPDYGHNRIRVVDPDTSIITTWLAGNTTCVNGTVQLYSVPQYGGTVRFAANGDVYVSGNLCQGTTTNVTLGIALRAGNGTMTRVAGLYSGVTTENADATATGFAELSDFIFDGNGDIVVALNGQHVVRRITMSSGKINTIAGTATKNGYAAATDVSAEPGAYVPATGALLYNPFRLALWPGNHVLVIDEYNYAARMIW